MLRPDDFVKSQLALWGWRYGREYGGHLSSCMIMSCLANRFRLGWGSWLEVIERIPQFTAEEEIPTGYPNLWDVAFTRLLHEVEGIYDNSGTDYSKGGLYWADLRRVNRQWFKDKILSQSGVHPRIADCNSLVIFK